MFLNVNDDIPSLMKGQVLHLIELHFFMKGVFEVNVFDLLLTEIKPANRLPSGAGRKENWRAKLGLESFFCPPGHDDILWSPAPLAWGSLCTDPSPSPIITEESGGLHKGSTWEPVCRLTEKVPLLYNYHIREYLTIIPGARMAIESIAHAGLKAEWAIDSGERGIIVLVKSN